MSWCVGRLRLKCDGMHTETRFRLSAKWMSSFKSAEESVQSTTGSRGVRIAVVMLDTPCSEVVWGVLATHSTRQFPLHFLPASPCAITFQPYSTHLHANNTQNNTILHWICRLSDYNIRTTVWKRRSGHWPSPFSDTNEKDIFSFGRMWEADRNQCMSKGMSVITFVRSFINQLRFFLDTHNYWRLFYEITNRCSYMQSILFHC